MDGGMGIGRERPRLLIDVDPDDALEAVRAAGRVRQDDPDLGPARAPRHPHGKTDETVELVVKRAFTAQHRLEDFGRDAPRLARPGRVGLAGGVGPGAGGDRG